MKDVPSTLGRIVIFEQEDLLNGGSCFRTLQSPHSHIQYFFSFGWGIREANDTVVLKGHTSEINVNLHKFPKVVTRKLP